MATPELCVEDGCERAPLEGDARCALHASRLGPKQLAPFSAAAQVVPAAVVAPAQLVSVDEPVLDVPAQPQPHASGWRQVGLSASALVVVVPGALWLMTSSISEACAPFLGPAWCARLPVPPPLVQQVGAWVLAAVWLAATTIAPWWAYRAARGRSRLARICGWTLLCATSLALLAAPVIGAGVLDYLIRIIK